MDHKKSVVFNRREFVVTTSMTCACAYLAPLAFGGDPPEPVFRISLAQWSLHRALRAGEIDPLNFPAIARNDYGIGAVEYVNQFYIEHGEDASYFKKLKSVADGEGVRSLLIMCDGEGALGDPHPPLRRQAVDNHQKWLDAAQLLGCHSIRVNATSDPSLDLDEQQLLVADGLRALCEVADEHAIDVLVENHGGPTSDGMWLAGLIEKVGHPRAGTLPDFGNFLIEADSEDPAGGRWYDRYRGVGELMPYAKAVSAKSFDFDDRGEDTATDFARMMTIVLDVGYRGWVGIEYEGSTLSEPDGVRATKKLLERVRTELTPRYLDPAATRG